MESLWEKLHQLVDQSKKSTELSGDLKSKLETIKAAAKNTTKHSGFTTKYLTSDEREGRYEPLEYRRNR